MTGFQVELPVLHQAATDMSTLATRVTWAMFHANSHVSSSIEGGTWFFDAGAEINALGDRLGELYSHAGVRPLFESASVALQQMARDYSEVDLEAARSADTTSTELGVEPDRDLHTGSHGGEPTVDAPAYSDAFDDPENVYDAWDSFWAIGDKITYITSFEWVGEPLARFNLPNPVKELLDRVEGDWPRLGRAIGAVDQLSSYWRSIARDVTQVRDALAAGWSGVAADATLEWFDLLQEACMEHARSLSDFEGRVRTEALAMKSAVDVVAGLIEDIAAFIPDLQGSIGDAALNLVEFVIRGVARIVDVVDKVLKAIDLVMVVAMAILTVFAQLCMGDGEFNHVPEPRALDVNG